jgi:hypothetical protein
MTWNDESARASAQGVWEPAHPPPVEPAELAPPASGSTPAFGGIRRTIATAALAVGLLVLGGTAVVLAADPSASPDPSATTAPSGGTTQPRTHTPGSTKDCPNMGGSGSGGSTAPSTNGPTSSPTTNL